MTDRPRRRTIGWGPLESCGLEQARARAVDASWRPTVRRHNNRIPLQCHDINVPPPPTSMPRSFYALHGRRAGVLLEISITVRGPAA
jgi:hypothetical protein